ncbi:MAG TPA: SRPBCC domain-containing protein [Opitutaceae bacterium]|jgi:activator of HSP90 ATPase
MKAVFESGARIISRRQALSGAALAVGGFALAIPTARADPDGGEVRAAETIHQEPEFKAQSNRIYEALLDERKFDALVRLSPDMHELMGPGSAATRIARSEGGSFCLFGGHIVGMNIELVPNARIVQAWRPANWPAGIFSIARFELIPAQGGTRIVFDHSGFPAGTAPHLAAGWKQHYWAPLALFLS